MVNQHAGTTDFVLLNWGPNIAAVFTKSILTNADNVAMGMLAAIVFVAIEHGALSERISRRVGLFSAVAILPVLVVSAAFFAIGAQFVTAGVGVVAALMIQIVVVPLARGQKSRLARLLRSADSIRRRDLAVRLPVAFPDAAPVGPSRLDGRRYPAGNASQHCGAARGHDPSPPP